MVKCDECGEEMPNRLLRLHKKSHRSSNKRKHILCDICNKVIVTMGMLEHFHLYPLCAECNCFDKIWMCVCFHFITFLHKNGYACLFDINTFRRWRIHVFFRQYLQMCSLNIFINPTRCQKWSYLKISFILAHWIHVFLLVICLLIFCTVYLGLFIVLKRWGTAGAHKGLGKGCLMHEDQCIQDMWQPLWAEYPD